jgi:hypothetical protein
LINRAKNLWEEGGRMKAGRVKLIG